MKTSHASMDSSSEFPSRRAMLKKVIALGAAVSIPCVPRTSRAADKVMRVACAGDSITEGTYNNVYPDMLQDLLGTDYQVKTTAWEAPRF
jgi:lysophospholipase L1-like esterase